MPPSSPCLVDVQSVAHTAQTNLHDSLMVDEVIALQVFSQEVLVLTLWLPSLLHFVALALLANLELFMCTRLFPLSYYHNNQQIHARAHLCVHTQHIN